MNLLRAIISKLLARKHLLLVLGLGWLAVAIGWIWNWDKEPIVGTWLGSELLPTGDARRVRFEAYPDGTFRIESPGGTKSGTWTFAEGWCRKHSRRDGPVAQCIWILAPDQVENYPYWQDLRAKEMLIRLSHVYELTFEGNSKLVAVTREGSLLQMLDGNWPRAKPLRHWLDESLAAIRKGEKIPPRQPNVGSYPFFEW